MKAGSKNWTTVAESKFSWEREALEFVRERFPSHEPYRAWANFEFIADDGSINEVDLLVFSPEGFFLIEIKSHLGKLSGDAGTWTWEHDGKLSTIDNPLIATNLKAKKLRSLLQRQKAFQKKGEFPYVEPLVFCSAPDLRCELQGNASFRVCLRDRDQAGTVPARPGIMAAISDRKKCPGLDPRPPKVLHNSPMAKLIGQAIDQAGIRPSQRVRKVSDYLLEHIIGEGPGYQDWLASHAQVPESKRRVRLYLVRAEATAEDRQTIERAARREFQLLDNFGHPGILRAYNFTEHELGPALLFEHDPLSLRLDHYLAQQKDKLSSAVQLDLMRQIAEVIQYAHDKKVIHRGLCPQSILVTNPSSERPRIKVFNWQVGYRESGSSNGASRVVSATSHVDRLVEDAATAYMAPETFTESNTGEHLDVFSLGTIAYHLFSGSAPASNAVELSEKLRNTTGLQISSVLNGAGEWLQYLIQAPTNPNVGNRTDSVADFLGILNEVERELTTPEHDYVDDPSRAQMGDLLPGGYSVVRRLGQGACSVALLVEYEGQDFVLKVANDPEHNARVRAEADVLSKQEMRHPCIVDFVRLIELGQHAGFLMRPVYAEKGKRLIETLGQRVRKEGKLHIDMLQRFGDDLLSVVNHLEEQGIPHRDIKPDNIAVGMVGRGDKLHLVLFDFSLSRSPPENIRAGTNGYLDPLLPLRKPPRWDLHAERYSAAITLYELATGALPKWGNGDTDPSHLGPTVEIIIEAELFDAPLRESLAAFFAQGLRRNIAERFDNAEEMLRTWRQCFEGIDDDGPLSDHADDAQLAALLADATFDTHISELGLGNRATNALDRANILTVEDLLSVPMRRLLRLRGVGNKTRREITSAVKTLRDRLGKPDREQPPVPEVAAPEPISVDVSSLSVDLLSERILKASDRDGETFQQLAPLLLGLDPKSTEFWPSQTDVARQLEVTRARVGQLLAKLQERWARDAALTRLRTDLAEIVNSQGGVMSAQELAETLLVARGSAQDEPRRTQLASAVLRAAVEVERGMSEPRYIVARDSNSVLIARNLDLANYARRLGEVADQIASEDPLLPPARILERLRKVPPGEGLASQALAIPDTRLIRLAAAASANAAVSSRQELYPRKMPAVRAMKLSQGAVLGQRLITVEQIRERVGGRYPEAIAIPERPALDELLREAGIELNWDATGKCGQGCYVSPIRDLISVTSGSEQLLRLPTSPGPSEAGQITPAEADARQFEERLQRSLKEGSFLALLVNPKHYEDARSELCRRLSLELIDLEGLFIDALQDVAGKASVQWNLVLDTDIQPNHGDWDKLKMLVARAMPAIEERLLGAQKTMLVIYPGLLARYDQMDLLSRLSQKVGRVGGIPGLWILLPGDNQALIDGKPVPLIGPGQRTRIPESWLSNLHRASGNGAAH